MTVLDAYALVALLLGEGAAPRVRELIREGSATISSVNLAECADVLRRRYGIDRGRVRGALAALTDWSLSVIAIDERHALRAADLRAEHYHRTRCPVSLGDCMLLAAATGDDRIATADRDVLVVAGREGIAMVEL